MAVTPSPSFIDDLHAHSGRCVSGPTGPGRVPSHQSDWIPSRKKALSDSECVEIKPDCVGS